MPTNGLRPVPFDSELWSWDAAPGSAVAHLGRSSVPLEDATTAVADVAFVDGAVELELAVGPERGFHGVMWRVRDDENFESFFVRPHQVGNPDAVQYTPVFNGISSWQLYHGPGFWAPISFPLDEWFTIRVVFSGNRGEVYVGDMNTPALAIGELKGPLERGRVGLFGGPGIHVAGFAFDSTGSVPLRAPAPSAVPAVPGIVPAWWVSDAFREEETARPRALEPGGLAARTWSRLASEPSGLVDLARINGIRDGRNTVFARATIHSARAQTKRLDFGFSDRAVVYLNGRPLYRGDETYRSRDYRFLGSIGYFDTLYLPLEEGENELVIEVSEDLGGWGLQARFTEPADLTFDA